MGVVAAGVMWMSRKGRGPGCRVLHGQTIAQTHRWWAWLLQVHSCHQLGVAGQHMHAFRSSASPAPLDGLAVKGIARNVVGALHLSTKPGGQHKTRRGSSLHCTAAWATTMPPAPTRSNQPSHSPSPLHTAPPHLGGEVQVAVAAGGARVNNHDDHRLAGGSAASSADGRAPPA